MTTYWSKCFLCQRENNDNLRSTDDSYVKLAERLPKFKEIGGAESLDFTCINNGSGILTTLRKNNALYHKDYEVLVSVSSFTITQNLRQILPRISLEIVTISVNFILISLKKFYQNLGWRTKL